LSAFGAVPGWEMFPMNKLREILTYEVYFFRGFSENFLDNLREIIKRYPLVNFSFAPEDTKPKHALRYCLVVREGSE
jgi:hypothetical protein